METSLGKIDTLDIAIPVFLPGNNRDWSEYAGIAKITADGEVFVKFQHQEAAQALTQMAKDKILLQVSFDYKITPKQIKEQNERYTKKIVSKVGDHPVMLNGEHVGTATIQTNGLIKIVTENDKNVYVINTNKKVEPSATITTPIEPK